MKCRVERNKILCSVIKSGIGERLIVQTFDSLRGMCFYHTAAERERKPLLGTFWNAWGQGDPMDSKPIVLNNMASPL